MTDRNASSYDLLDAQKILATLLPKTRGAALRKDEDAAETHGYVRLAAKALPRPLETSPAAPSQSGTESAPIAAVTLPEKFTSWEDCIAWCIELMGAEAAFVVDSQGFIIAARGLVPAHGFECTGAELVYSMDQLERIDSEAGKLSWIDLDYAKHRLVGFVTPGDAAECFIVGIIGPDSSYNNYKNTVSFQIIESLATMN